MAKVSFPITQFVKPDGSPVANGYLQLSLNQDAQAPIGPDTTPPNMLVSSTGLVLNSYFTADTGRGNYFPGVSGTSESQFLLTLGLLEAYAAVGNTTALSLAKLCLSPIQSVLYRGYPVPDPVGPTNIFAPHWLFDVAGPFVSAVINYGPQLGGFANTYQFTDGVAVIPDPAQGEAHIFFQAMTPDYTLIYLSPYSPPATGTAYAIASYVYTEGTGTTVTLSESFTGELQVIYSVLDGPNIVPNQPFEAFPDWRALGVGEIDSACDTYNWGYRTFTAAASATGDATYTDMATATTQQALVVYPVNNQRQWIAPSIQLQPLSQSGAFEYTDNVPAPTLACNNAGSIVLTQDATPTAGSTSQFGVASINDTFASDDTVTWNFQVDGIGTGTQDVQLYIDTTNQNPYDPTNRYVYDFSATLGTPYNLTGLVLSDFVNSDSTPLAADSAVYTCGVQIPGEMPKGLTVTINLVQAYPNITIMYEDGCVPFTANFLSATGPYGASLIGWQGPSYSGYQSPWMFQTLYGDNASNVATNVQFLRDAQTAWTNQSATGDSGPFCPCFYFDKPDSVEYGPVNTFGWDGPDPNTEWVGYQVRPLAELAELVLACTGSESYFSQAVSVTNTFLEWFDTNWTTAAVNNGPPSIFPQSGAQVTYPEPHAVALITRACLKMLQAGQSNAACQSLITKALAFWSYWYTSTGIYAGTFCGTTSGIFSFWVGEILRTQSDLYLYYQSSDPDIAAQCLTWINGAVAFVARSVTTVPSGSQIAAGRSVKIPLDSNGSIVGSPVFWENASLNPPNTYYCYSCFSASGQKVVSNERLTI
jgi:hypothetical protein